jgi:DNA-binding MarR family transcriptional regulator
VSGTVAFELHAVTAKLDRAADRLLQAELGLSYRRFLPLFMISELGASTQRALAQKLDVSEPSVSRMTSVLADAGLLVVESRPGTGNRNRLALTATGDRLVRDCKKLLSDKLAVIVAEAGLPIDEYVQHTRRLSMALDEAEQRALQ